MNSVRLGDIASLKTGPFGTQLSASEYVSNGIPVINVRNIGYGEIITSDLEYVGDETAQRLQEHLLHKGDIVFGRKGSVDRHAFIDDRYDGWMQGSDCIRVRTKENINSHFISHYLKLDSVKKQINSSAVGSTMASLNTDILNSIQIVLPSLETQDHIEALLSVIEEKIDLNTRICAELEAMASILYDYWFVQFDFPDAQGRPYRTSGGEMEYCPTLGREMPKGWKTKKLGEIATFRNGINYEKTVVGDKEYRIVNVRDITSTSFLIEEHNLDTISLPCKQAEKYLISTEDIIIARSGTPGATRLLLEVAFPTIFCGFIICCKPVDELYKLYFFHLLKKYEGTSATKTGGSILQNVSQDTLKTINIPVPPDDILLRFNVAVSPYFAQLQQCLKENYELTTLRDWLLPMLMNKQAKVEGR